MKTIPKLCHRFKLQQ